jgi:hypothetical protein
MRAVLLGWLVLLAVVCAPRAGRVEAASPGAVGRAVVDAVRGAAEVPGTRARSGQSGRPERPPAFHGGISPLDRRTIGIITPVLWRPGCPVPLEDLRLLRVDHWGFDGREHRGEVIIHEDYAGDVLRVMRRLWELRFPIERMEPVNTYTGPDPEVAANNTTALNCRSVRGVSGVWSEHSYGRAIDINPVRNPYVSADGRVLPAEGVRFVDRSRRVLGAIHSGDPVVRAFASIGWEWGGEWTEPVDYQHFSATGR